MMKEKEMQKIIDEAGVEHFRSGRFEEAGQLFEQLILDDEFAEFLTIPAYENI